MNEDSSYWKGYKDGYEKGEKKGFKAGYAKALQFALKRLNEEEVPKMNKSIQNIIDSHVGWEGHGLPDDLPDIEPPEPQIIEWTPLTCSMCGQPVTKRGVFDCGCFDRLKEVNVCMDYDELYEERRGADETSNT